MKKLLITITGAIFLLAAASCSKSLDEKIESNDLEAEDYAEMVAYISEAMDELNDINNNYGPDEIEEAHELMSEVVSEYPEAKRYMNICVKAYRNGDSEIEEGVDSSEMTQLMDYQSRGWFNFW